MLLFHHMLNVPRKKMWVTWHRTSRQGKEEYPSPYVDDLLELFPGKALQAPMPAANAFVPNMEDAASWRDIANALALAGAMPKSCPPQLEWTSAGIDVESRRDAVGIFDCFDGALSDSAMVGHIAGLFGKSHLFSVDQLEAYAACPFHFLIERVLRVEEAGIPVAEFDSMVRGTIMHEVLQRFHEEYKGVPAGEIDFDEGAESLRRILQEVFHDTSWRSSTAPAGVEAVEQRRLDVILCRYLRIEQDRAENQWRPWHFEVGFGRNRGKLKDPISTNDPFALDVPPDPVLFSGRIDRIDIDDEGQARIIDYKSSAAVQAGDIDRGLSLQLTIYALALQEMLLKIPCAEAWFVTVGRKNRVHGLGRKKEVRTERERTARECVASSVAGIRAGYFPPKPSDKACAYCTAARACRYDASRIERKTDR
jgi:RecB family exonuclease